MSIYPRKAVRAALVAAVVAVTSGVTGAPVSAEPQRVEQLDTPPPRPDTVFKEFAGERTLELADLEGEVVMLHYWATWCPPCVVELPHVDELSRDYAHTPLKVVAVSVDEKPKKLRRFLRRMDKKLPTLVPWWDRGGDSFEAIDGGALPFTVIYDQRGTEIIRLRGTFDWSDDKARSVIDQMLGIDGETG